MAPRRQKPQTIAQSGITVIVTLRRSITYFGLKADIAGTTNDWPAAKNVPLPLWRQVRGCRPLMRQYGTALQKAEAWCRLLLA